MSDPPRQSSRPGRDRPAYGGDEDLDDLEVIELDAEQIAGGGRPHTEGSGDGLRPTGDRATGGG